MAEEMDRFDPLPEDWSRALCVVAHPDDMEFGAAAAVARWTGQGKDVVYCMVSSGEAGIDGLPPEDCRPVREAEQVASARVVGVQTVEFLRQPDGILEYGVPLRREIAAVVRRHRPDVVVTSNFRDTWGGANLNQADHVATGRAVVDAVRDAGNRWVFPELLEEGLEPWSVRWLLAGGHERPTHGVDVTGEPLERGIASLEAHAEYLAALPGHPSPRTMITGITAMQGRAMGVPHAVLLRVWDFHAPPPIAAEVERAAAGLPADADG
jgi:LmbE family N-acetylglucosaminyl deacetylase